VGLPTASATGAVGEWGSYRTKWCGGGGASCAHHHSGTDAGGGGDRCVVLRGAPLRGPLAIRTIRREHQQLHEQDRRRLRQLDRNPLSTSVGLVPVMDLGKIEECAVP